jgi:PKD repeat protein
MHRACSRKTRPDGRTDSAAAARDFEPRKNESRKSRAAPQTRTDHGLVLIAAANSIFSMKSPTQARSCGVIRGPRIRWGAAVMLALFISFIASVQPVIEQPADTLHIAAYSVERFSGFASTSSGEVMRWDWSYGDGAYGIGPEVAHIYAAPGTYTVTLTVTDDQGSVGSTTATVTTVALPGTDYYIAANGSDNNDGKSASTPWATLSKAFGKLGNVKGVPPRILLNCGDTFSWPTSASVPAPSILGSYGNGALPVIAMGATQDIYREEGSGGVGSDWGYSVYLTDLDIQWPARSSQSVQLRIRGSQVVGCLVENGAIVVSTGYARIFVMNSVVAGAEHCGFYGSGDWDALYNCAFYGNGNDGTFDHQAYFSSATHVLVKSCILDGNDAGPNGVAFGCKFSGVRQGYLVGNYCTGGRYGFDLGANSDNREGQQLVVERNRIRRCGDNQQAGAIWISYVNGMLIRNNTFELNGPASGQAGIMIKGNSATQLAQNVRIYHNTFFGDAGPEIDAEDFVTAVTARNNIFVHANSNFITGPTAIDSDWNLFWAQGSYKVNEPHSVKGDPLFVNPGVGDYRLQLGSAAIDIGTVLSVVPVDFLLEPRVSGAEPDAGAFEYQW